MACSFFCTCVMLRSDCKEKELDEEGKKMLTSEFQLIDNEGNVRAKKQVLGHLQGNFNEIRSKEKIVYPWKVTCDITRAEMIINENTTQQDWRDYAEWIMRLL